MKKLACITLAGLLLLLWSALPLCAKEPYYPYQSYDEYYKKQELPSPPPPDNSRQPESPVKERPRPEQPIMLTQPPEFLFPSELGFGVAVGVPYDMFYIAGAYYFLKGSSWYRASSYRGPWMFLGLSQVPPELRKHKLADIHKARNREFNIFWKNRDHYQGRYFRPGMENQETPKVRH
jgi:hypothetical protein